MIIRRSKLRQVVSGLLRGRGGYRIGKCCICKSVALYAMRMGGEKLICIRCGSSGRQRSVVSVMNKHFVGWERVSIHESSPSGATFRMFNDVCTNYIPTFYWPDVPCGAMRNGFKCEDLQKQTFEDCTFDLVLTQDVFEHITDPFRAFREVARTLRPGGAHIFTVPIDGRERSVRRTLYRGNEPIHVLEPRYHGNPIDPNGSLVVTDWGTDIVDVIRDATGLDTTLLRIRDVEEGIEGRHPMNTHSELFITRKPVV